jgi:hypothetical protein
MELLGDLGLDGSVGYHHDYILDRFTSELENATPNINLDRSRTSSIGYQISTQKFVDTTLQ